MHSVICNMLCVVYVYALSHSCTHTNTHTHAHTHSHKHTHMHTLTHSYTHTHTHTPQVLTLTGTARLIQTRWFTLVSLDGFEKAWSSFLDIIQTCALSASTEVSILMVYTVHSCYVYIIYTHIMYNRAVVFLFSSCSILYTCTCTFSGVEYVVH